MRNQAIPVATTTLPTTHNPSHISSANHPCKTATISYCKTSRPGRFYKQRHDLADTNLFTNYGDSIYTEKRVNVVRIFFQNVKGLTYSNTGDDYEYYLSHLHQLQVDIAGLSETNTPWQHHHIKSEFLSRVRKIYSLAKATFSSPSLAIDPIPETEKFQSGGCALIVQGQWTTTIHKNTIQDETGLGRWTGISLRGRQDKTLSIIVGYRTCKGTIKSTGLGTTYHREYVYLAEKTAKSPNPRKAYLQDLESTVRNLQISGHAILIMMDANDTLCNGNDLDQWRERLGLYDLHRHHPAPSTYMGSNSRRIDFIFGCHQVAEYVKAAGTLSYHDGPQSDHRGMFVDIDIAEILSYNANLNPIRSSRARILRTSNPEMVAEYHRSMLQYYTDHNMEQRIQTLQSTYSTMPRSEIRRQLEAWDRDQGRAMRHAEVALSTPKRKYAWSPELRNAGIIKRYWRLRLKETQHSNANYQATIARLQNQIRLVDANFQFPHINSILSSAEIRKHLNQATRCLHKTQKAATELRFKTYQDLLAVYQSDTDPNTVKESARKAKIVKRTIRTEKIRDMFRKIRFTAKHILPDQQTGITQLKIPQLPRDDERAPNPEEFQEFISQSNSNDIIWDTVLDQESIEHILLQYNRKSFRAASKSPCGHGLIYDALTFSSLTEMGREILEGRIPQDLYGDDANLREFLASFTIPEHIKNRPPIKTSMSADEIARGISKWKESTSTSPSGRHLGHYKAIIQEPRLLTCLASFMQIAIKSGISISRWSKATNVMLEKDTGNPCIHRLRIIHLFEADFNLYMKLQWGKRLVLRATKHNLLNAGQFGSVPGHSTLEPIMLTQLTNDNCRILKRNLARFDNDASACFDRIIVPLAMMAARRCGMSEEAVRIHAESLESMQYSVKTAYGISKASYSGTKEEPLFGTGQGSGASPAAWLTLVVLIMNTMDSVVKDRVTFKSPDSNMTHSRLIDAFVDDTSLSFTDHGFQSFEELAQRLTTIASVWNTLLYYSGGSLNLQKCAYHVTTWEWHHGRPRVYQIPSTHTSHAVSVTSYTTGDTETISFQSYSQPHRILGVHLTASGDFSHQIALLKRKADTFANRLYSPRLTSKDIITFLRTTYVPAMGYVLPSLAVDEEALHTVQSQLLAVVLRRLGMSSKTPIPLRHGPSEMGGLELPDLRTEMGISQLKLMRNAIFAATGVGHLILISLKYSQIESGISEPLLEKPDIPLLYLTPTWLTSVRQFLYQHNLTLSITDTLLIRFQGSHDRCIMQPEILKHYSPQQQLDINLVRLHLQAITLSDISDPTGKNISTWALQGARPPHHHDRINWPRQLPPTKHQIKTWHRYISSNFLRYGTTWVNRLGAIRPNNWKEFQRFRDAASACTNQQPVQYDSLKKYLKSLPKWHKRLLEHYTQKTSDKEIWKSFRRKGQILEIISDGGLAAHFGTYGWKIVTLNPHDIVLYEGSGSIDGPEEIGSSTRSELGGFTAPLLLITAIARFWGLRHRCDFRWITDSQSAISKVKMYIRPGHRKYQPYPNHSDYITTIRELYNELRRPCEMTWIKGHQDSDKAYDELPREAKYNVDVDALATRHRTNILSKPMRKTEHIRCQQITLTINGVRFPGNWDSNLRWSINGAYTKLYLMDKHNWSESIWNTIDFQVVKSFSNQQELKHRRQWFKFMHNLQPLGKRLQTMGGHLVSHEELDRCPCCHCSSEDQLHFLTCSQNSNHAKAHKALATGGSTSKENHAFTKIMSSCLEQWLSDPKTSPSIRHFLPTQPLNPYRDNYSSHIITILQQALDEQSKIGWINAIRGFLSTKWRQLAASHMSNPEALPQEQEGHRRMSIAIHRIQDFVRTRWEGRNEALHQINQDNTAANITLEAAEISHYFNQPHLLPVGDQHYCSGSLTKLLRSRPAYRRRWLRRVRQSRATLLKSQSRQAQITTYFPRQSTTTSTQSTTNEQRGHPNIHIINVLRNNHAPQPQRAKITHFFPGRPPDQHFNHHHDPMPSLKSPA